MPPIKIVIVGGVAGGASAAAKARRTNEGAEIIVFEKGPFVSFANCGLPYYVGDTITDREDLLLQTPEKFGIGFGSRCTFFMKCWLFNPLKIRHSQESYH